MAFVELAARTEPLKGLPVLSLDDLDDDVLLLCGIGGMTEIKARVIADALARGHRFAPGLDRRRCDRRTRHRPRYGLVVCAGAVVTADVTIGEHVAVHVNCSVGHDARHRRPRHRLPRRLRLGLGLGRPQGTSSVRAPP